MYMMWHVDKYKITFKLSLLLHRAFCRITLIITATNALTQSFTLKHLKSLQHISILRSSSGSYVAPC